VHQLFIDFKEACDSTRREVLHNILVEFGVPAKVVRLITMCLNETYHKVSVRKHFSDTFPFKNSFKQGMLHCNWFSTLLKICHLVGSSKPERLEINGTHQLLVFADNVNIFAESIHTIKKNTEAIIVARKEIGLEVNAEKTKYVVMS
jgi:hypothetical protein